MTVVHALVARLFRFVARSAFKGLEPSIAWPRRFEHVHGLEHETRLSCLSCAMSHTVSPHYSLRSLQAGRVSKYVPIRHGLLLCSLPLQVADFGGRVCILVEQADGRFLDGIGWNGIR